MEPRLNLFSSRIATEVMKRLVSVDAATGDNVPIRTRELVKIRASQINGCALCLDMHTKDAAAAGESQLRLNLVANWRDSTVFTPAERAALDLAEQGCRIGDGSQVSDQCWAEATKHYDDEQLAALTAQIATIAAFNTLNVVTR